MAKSRRFPPGDSAPDFSRLSSHDQVPDDPHWQPGDEEAPRASSSEEDEPTDRPDAPPTQSDCASADQRLVGTHSPAGDSHVFFDADNPVSAEMLLGETRALTSESAPAAAQAPLDADSVLSAAPDFDDPQAANGNDKSSQLTDVGIPCFEGPPGVEGPAAGSTEVTDETQQPAAAAASESHAPADVESAEPAEPEEAPAPVEFAAVDVVSAPASAAAAAIAETTPRSGERTSPRTARTSASPPIEETDRRRMMMILLASYASAITIAFLWLWLSHNTARPHELESLPDVAPLGPNEFRYAPQSAAMPRGHTLPLGTATQLGSIKIEPLRVTRGPVQYTHYSDPSQSKPPTEPVLKLWLRFTNVSSDQWIAPLDPPLLLTRSYQHESDTVLANQLLLPADRASQKPAYVIDHPTTSEWDLAGQKLGQRLKPGESIETYIPLEPDSDKHLTGDLLWRVHFRKGYHAATGHGVTTMIEVPFSTADIQNEPSAPT